MITVYLGVASAATVLALSSIRNVVQTMHLINNKCTIISPDSGAGAATRIGPLDKSDEIFQQYINPSCSKLNIPTSKTTEDILQDLQNMRRRDLLKLYILCDAPEETKRIKGLWQGILLDNNPVLTSASGFITNVLFGLGHGKWLGKRLDVSVEGETIGINMFENKIEDKGFGSNHKFNYFKSESKFGGESIILEYKAFQNILSPWYTMIDEARVLKLCSKDGNVGDKSILLCMGSMAWSSHLNVQPFCLVESNEDNFVEGNKKIL